MTATSARILLWLPRILGIAVALFLGVFALDAFSGQRLAEAVPDFAKHLLPALIVLGVVAVAWRYPAFGGVAFIGFALFYAISVRRLDWIAVIAGPLLTVGLLFLWNAVARPGSAASRWQS